MLIIGEVEIDIDTETSTVSMSIKNVHVNDLPRMMGSVIAIVHKEIQDAETKESFSQPVCTTVQ